jgi:O-antigen/teichoic acid export membrane protein
LVKTFPVSQVKLNIIANFAGKAWAALMNLAFIPLYIKFLGMEAYGLIGFFATLQALSGLLDLGLGTTLNRELARYSAQPGRGQEMRDLLRTLETIYWGMVILISVTLISVAPFIAEYWITAENLSVETVQLSIVLMGIAIAFQLLLSFYAGGLMGLQRQALYNVLNSGLATLRGVGAVLILWLVSPTIEAFFSWQVVLSLLSTALMALALWHSLPKGKRTARFDRQRLHSIWRFAAGMTAISVIGLFLIQLDKILLSTLLPLKIFGYYTLASVAAATLYILLIGPISTALFPKFSQLVALNHNQELTLLYHRACQLMSVVMLPAALVLAMFSYEVMLLWTGDPITTKNTHWLVSLLVIGNALSGLLNLPSALLLAYGWTNLVFYSHVVAVLLLVPMLIVMVHYYDAIGAAIVWVLLNMAYILIVIQIMHQRLLKGEQWGWYREDVGMPLVAALATASLGRWLLPANMAPLTTVVYIAGVSLVTLTVTAMVTPQVRLWLKNYFFRWKASCQ